MLIVGYGFVSILQQVAMLVFHFSHDLHAAPFVHLIGQFIIVAVGVSVFAVSEGVPVEFSSN